jgi:hypothetical protein
MMILVQGFGAPTNMIVGVERFAGITGGLLMVTIVTLLTATFVSPLAASPP